MINNNLALILTVAALLFAACQTDGKGSILDETGNGNGTQTEEGEMRFVAIEQKAMTAIVVNTKSGEIEWSWDISKSGIAAAHQTWLKTNLAEVKPVYNGEYILLVGEGVALIRRSDHKAVWYANVSGNPHSGEILPDGNIVVACSTYAPSSASDQLHLFKVDYNSFPPSSPVQSLPLVFGHNAVWDRSREVLWATAKNVVNCYTYDPSVPALTLKETISVPETTPDVHDLFPVYGEDKMWLTTLSNVYKFNPATGGFENFPVTPTSRNVKSVSSGPAGYSTVIITPTEQHWSYKVLDTRGNAVWTGDSGLRMYKARWIVDNTFSYPQDHEFPGK